MANDIVMLVDGIKGEAKDREFPESIEILSWQWDLTQRGMPGQTTVTGNSNSSSTNRSSNIPSNMNTSGGKGDRAHTVSVSDIIVRKHTDQSSIMLGQYLLKNKVIKEVKIINRKVSGQEVDGKHHFAYLVFTLYDVRITNYTAGNQNGQTLPMESFTLNFAKVVYTYTRQHEKGGRDVDVLLEYTVPGAFTSDAELRDLRKR